MYVRRQLQALVRRRSPTTSLATEGSSDAGDCPQNCRQHHHNHGEAQTPAKQLGCDGGSRRVSAPQCNLCYPAGRVAYVGRDETEEEQDGLERIFARLQVAAMTDEGKKGSKAQEPKPTNDEVVGNST